MKLCITLVNVGLPLSPTATISFTAPLLELFVEASFFFCKDRLIAAKAASFRGLPLGVSKEFGVLAEALDGAVDVEDLDRVERHRDR